MANDTELNNDAADKETKNPKGPKKVSGPQFKMRGKEKIYHHLFKGLLGTFLKNQSWIKGDLKLEKVEHVHHFHSVNSLGMEQKFTTTVGGHFHEVKWEIGKNGEPVATCGPAMKKIVRATTKGQKTSIVPVRFYGGKQVNDDTGEEREHYVADPHKHEMIYLGTDELTADMVRETQKGTAQAIQALEPRAIDGFNEGDR